MESTAPGATTTLRYWVDLNLGMAEYRSENYAQAEQHLTKVVNQDRLGEQNGDRSRLVRSMARHHLGKHDEALADFKTAQERILPLPDRDLSHRDFRNGIVGTQAALLYVEARTLLDLPNDSSTETPDEATPDENEASSDTAPTKQETPDETKETAEPGK